MTTKSQRSKDRIAEVERALVERVIEAMDADPEQWTKPWVEAFASGLPYNARTGRTYSGGNMWWLAIAGSLDDRCDVQAWATYNQWRDLGGQIRKGESGETILVPKTFKRTETDPVTGDEVERRGVYFGTATVFNYCQQDGAVIEAPQVDERRPLAEAYFAAVGARVVTGGDRACYVPTVDEIRIPGFDAFTSAAGYYSTLGHEHVHWTGHESRLDRARHDQRGDDVYAFEELIAELGAVLLGGQLGYETEPRQDHAAYLVTWRAQLAADPKVMWRAATAASKAVAFMTERSEKSSDLTSVA